MSSKRRKTKSGSGTLLAGSIVVCGIITICAVGWVASFSVASFLVVVL